MSQLPALDLRQVQPPRPINIEAEHAILGILLYDNTALESAEGLAAHHFAEPLHGAIFDEVTTAIRANRLADPLLLHERLTSRGGTGYAEIGGIGFLANLVDHAPPAANAPDYARTIIDLAMRRDIIDLASVTSARAAGGSEDAESLLVGLERGASDIARQSIGRDMWRPAWEVTANAVRLARERNGRIDLSTGLADLDRMTGGFRRGEMAIVAGRPAMGKSGAALALAKALAASGKGVAFFSMEMPDVALGLRMACDLAFDPYAPSHFRISYFDADQGRLNSDQWRDLARAEETMADWPLLFDTRPGLTTSQMEANARRAFRRWESSGIERGAVIVDHLTIAKPDQDRSGNKVAEVGDISRGLAEMAKRLDVPVIALCQLSRDVEKRDTKDKRPGLSDLRWSGEIEQDARLVTFLYRPEYYLKKPQDEQDDTAMMEWRQKLDKVRHKLWWLVEKNNNGPTGEVETFCDVACSAIRDKLGGRS